MRFGLIKPPALLVAVILRFSYKSEWRKSLIDGNLLQKQKIMNICVRE